VKIDDDILNSAIEYCIDEYVRLIEHREMLREFWFKGMTISGIAEKHNISETSVKKVLYNIGDKVLLRADKISRKNN
jgi:DNA-binding NarL/FixJ family response regulator